MYLKIDIDKLEVGMHVVNTGLPWVSHPHVYSVEGEISSPVRIANIKREGFSTVYIDTEKGSYRLRTGKTGKRAAGIGTLPDLSGLVEAGVVQPPRIVPLEQEMPRAKVLYAQTLRYAEEFINRARQDGLANIDGARVVVAELLESVVRNRDALGCFSKLQSHDDYSYSHCVNVSVLALSFGYFLGLARETLHDVGLAAICHDLGKASIPVEVLNKPGPLTEEEFALIRRHPLDGHAMAREAGASKAALRGILEHHEKSNGTGYPGGLTEHRISLPARIIGLCDIYDALTSLRPYKKAISPMKAMSVIFGLRGQEYHTATLERFIKCLGIYPVGCMVRLTSGEYAAVCEINPGEPLRPKVKVLLDPDMGPVEPRVEDLAARGGGPHSALAIESALDSPPEDLDILASISPIE